jgi:hypothetical protein
LQGFGGYTRGCASASPRNNTATKREEHPISKHQPLLVPNRYQRRGSGVTVGDSHKGPLIIGEKPISSQNNKNTNELTNCKLHPAQSRPGDRSPRPWQPQWPVKRSAPAPLRRNSASLEGPGAVLLKLHLARGARCRTTETPPRSRAGRPLGRDSASLEGWTPPRSGLHLARGLHAPSLLTGEVNAPTRHGRLGQRRIPAMPSL